MGLAAAPALQAPQARQAPQVNWMNDDGTDLVDLPMQDYRREDAALQDANTLLEFAAQDDEPQTPPWSVAARETRTADMEANAPSALRFMTTPIAASPIPAQDFQLVGLT